MQLAPAKAVQLAHPSTEVLIAWTRSASWRNRLLASVWCDSGSISAIGSSLIWSCSFADYWRDLPILRWPA